MAITTPEQAHEVVAQAVKRATERYVASLAKDADPARFALVLQQPMPAMVARVLRSVEENFWRREVARRQRDIRFLYNDPSIEGAVKTWDKNLRSVMALSRKELKQLVERALTLQLDAIIAPMKCLETNYFSRQETITAKNAVIIATHLGLAEHYSRAFTFMAQDDENQTLKPSDVRRIIRDADAKENGGSQDLGALASLSQAMLVLGLRADDETGEAPGDLAQAFMVLQGTPAGVEKVKEACEGKARVDLLDLQDLFVSEKPEVEEPAQGSEEVSQFLEEIGAEGEIIPAEEGAGSSGGVRFILTDEEKQAYVARAVGRHVHLIEPIMKAVEGALTWEEVDRAINDMLPDNVRDEDLSARSYKSRI